MKFIDKIHALTEEVKITTSLTTSLEIQRELDKLHIEPLPSGLYLVTDDESVYKKFSRYEEAADFVDEVARRATTYQSDYLWGLVQDTPQFIAGVSPQEAMEGWR